MTVDGFLNVLQDTYSFFDRLEVTPGFLIGFAALLGLAALLAIREAAAWFFKVEDVKKDIGRLQEIAIQLESEIRVMQRLMHQQTATETPRMAIVEAPLAEPAASAADETEDSKTTNAFAIAASGDEPDEFQNGPTRIKSDRKPAPGSFPISH